MPDPIPRRKPSRRRTGTAAPDIRAVAARAGVSTATVSRAVSGRGAVAPETRARVEAAVAEIGYRPSAVGRSLRTARTMVLAVVVPDLSNPVFLPFLRGVQETARAHGYVVMVADAEGSAAVEARQLERLADQWVDGVVMAGRPRHPAAVRALRDAGTIVLDGDSPFGRPLWSAEVVEAGAIDDVVTRLAALGHRRVALVGGGGYPGGMGESRRRVVSACCAAAGVHLTVHHLAHGAGSDPAADLADLVRREAVTALVCGSHKRVPALLEALDGAGLTVPGAVSLVVFGDSPWARAHRPALDVVHRDLRAVGIRATEHLVTSLSAPTSTRAIEVEPAVYLVRASTGPPRVGLR